MNRKYIEELKQAAFEEIDLHRQRIIELGKSIWKEPEQGFQEYKTAEKVAAAFRELDIPFESGLALTGVKGRLTGATPGPTVAVIGELDALINPDHPEADKDTGAVHACGHFAQIAAIIGAGYGLKSILPKLSGEVVLFAVPAEEGINLDFRKGLRDEGKIKYFSGKQELVRIGAFDDIDLSFMQHNGEGEGPVNATFRTNNAFISKVVRFSGKASHAAGAPEKGINALQAYTIAQAAINAQRETFKDEDAVRVHGIVTRGGTSVNVTPGEVVVEMLLRAKTLEALKDVDKKINLSLRAGGMGVGAAVEIATYPGYLPLVQNSQLADCWTRNAEAVLGAGQVKDMGHSAGSTDMGDLSQLMPCIHPLIEGGFYGTLHGSDFKLFDEDTAFIIPAKIATATVIDLLSGEAEEATRIIEGYSPPLTKKSYLDLLDSYSYSEEFSSI
ncbi:amidohydrolase [Marispirochaeta aestuarii]|uniref:amidohydrolase n=1 Tax=Marispirochaeta aestuarii TaxID=1963862 RepID=UPI0029C6F815|nr:amidohydrolase [Marispirochaeta aestuarii]